MAAFFNPGAPARVPITDDVILDQLMNGNLSEIEDFDDDDLEFEPNTLFDQLACENLFDGDNPNEDEETSHQTSVLMCPPMVQPPSTSMLQPPASLMAQHPPPPRTQCPSTMQPSCPSLSSMSRRYRERTLSQELATTSRLAVKRAPPQTEADELQDEKRPKPGSRTPSSDEESDSSTPPPIPERKLDAPITRHINPPKSPSPTKTLPDIPTDTQEMDAEPVPGPSIAPNTYARIAAAPKATQPPSPRTTGPTPPTEKPTAAKTTLAPPANGPTERNMAPKKKRKRRKKKKATTPAVETRVLPPPNYTPQQTRQQANQPREQYQRRKATIATPATQTPYIPTTVEEALTEVVGVVIKILGDVLNAMTTGSNPPNGDIRRPSPTVSH
ncbi:unnamed protein product [Parnassius apollo]|uniref:(apollo) hypothetical protein n=1 Tax=Parnassius apollo TaxID=110799 RepID=A0A8S3WRM7_PARAO|nr:unnamed protein product [Parnassius apollo]